jgi:pimeloyl-ACP methyl ester carboxylesterase
MRFGIRSFPVAGESSGGLIALQMALQRPERLLSLVVIEPA